jgi:hypothetical protein
MTQVSRSNIQLDKQTSKKPKEILKPVTEDKTKIQKENVTKLFTTLLSQKEKKKPLKNKEQVQKSEKSSKKVKKIQTKSENVENQNSKPVKKNFNTKLFPTNSKEKVQPLGDSIEKSIQKKSVKKEKLKTEKSTRNNLKKFRHRVRYYGKYNCENCSNNWSSGYAYKDIHQKCEECEEKVFPYELHTLKTPKGRSKQPHRKDLCGMCEDDKKNGTEFCGKSENENVEICKKLVNSLKTLMICQRLLKNKK